MFDNYAAGDYQLVPGPGGSPFNVDHEPCTGTTHDLGIFDWANLAAAENAREDDL